MSAARMQDYDCLCGEFGGLGAVLLQFCKAFVIIDI